MGVGVGVGVFMGMCARVGNTLHIAEYLEQDRRYNCTTHTHALGTPPFQSTWRPPAAAITHLLLVHYKSIVK